MYDERYGDIHFDEEDPNSEFYNPKCIRDVYIDLANGLFDKAFNLNDDDYYYDDADDEEDEEEDEEAYDDGYYDADNEFDDY